MKIKIETYKRQTIEYDDELDKFVCDISLNDRDKSTKRQSLKDVRKEIDTFIKENLEFKPFKIFKKSTYGRELELLTVKGIRTDGLFVVESAKYKRIELINFEREMNRDREYGDRYYEFDANIQDKMKELDKEDEAHRKQMHDKEKAALKPLKKFDLATVKGYIDAFKKPKS